MVEVKNRPCAATFKSDDAGRLFTAVITTDAVDAVGEVMIPTGMDAKEYYARGGPVFWNHDYDKPIGKTIGKLRVVARRVEADFVFADRPENHEGEWFPATVQSLIEQDIIRGVSIGFHRKEGRNPTTKDLETYGADVKYVTSKWVLSEWSIAPVQCNPEALITAVKSGAVSRETCKSLFDIDLSEKQELATPKKRVVIYVPRPARIDNRNDDAKLGVAKLLGLLYL